MDCLVLTIDCLIPTPVGTEEISLKRGKIENLNNLFYHCQRFVATEYASGKRAVLYKNIELLCWTAFSVDYVFISKFDHHLLTKNFIKHIPSKHESSTCSWSEAEKLFKQSRDYVLEVTMEQFRIGPINFTLHFFGNHRVNYQVSLSSSSWFVHDRYLRPDK